MSILDLWLPILVSAVVVWIFSAVVWMVLPWHKNDFSKVGDEEGARAAMQGLKPGIYNLPHVLDPKELKDPAVARKFEEGPLAFITILPNGMPPMSRNMGLSFAYNLFVGVLAAYLVSRTLGADAAYLGTFRIAGCTAFIAYGVAYIQDSIWFGRPFSITAKSLLDAFLYGLLTGGVFGWLA